MGASKVARGRRHVTLAEAKEALERGTGEPITGELMDFDAGLLSGKTTYTEEDAKRWRQLPTYVPQPTQRRSSMPSKVLFIIRPKQPLTCKQQDEVQKAITKWWESPYAEPLTLILPPGCEVNVKQVGREVLEDLPAIQVEYEKPG